MIALILLAAGSGCASKDKDKPSFTDIETQAFNDLQAEIRIVIVNKEHADQVIAITDELKASFDELRVHLAERSGKLQTLNADYDAPKEDFITLFDNIQKDIARNQKITSKLHRQMKEVTTDKEWQALKKLRNSTMEAIINSIQSS